MMAGMTGKPTSLAAGGSLKDQHLEGGPTDWSRYPVVMSSMSGTGPAYRSGSFNMSPGTTSTPSQAAAITAIVTQAITPVERASQNAMSAVQSSQAQSATAAQQSAIQNAQQANILKSIDARLAQLNGGMFRAMRDAVAQAGQ
jgi:hypothetical protein